MLPSATELDAGPDEAAPSRGAPPWRSILGWLALAIVLACCVLVLVTLEPRLLLRNTTTTGGDTGAHVWWPAYLRDHLLPWRIAGWAPDWYAGFPAGQFYFPTPALLIVALDLALPYNIAFKLVTALGPVLLPAGVYVFARGLRAPQIVGAGLAVGATSFLFFSGDTGTSDAARSIAFNQRIMGGNLASTLAGEFSFSLALALAFFTLGTLAMALRSGRMLWLPAVLLAATVTSHLVVGIFVAIGAAIVWLFSRPGRSVGRAAAIGGVGALLTAVWSVPLLATLAYTTDMRYEPIRQYVDYLFPSGLWRPHGAVPFQWGAAVLVTVALAAAIVRRRSATFVLALLTVTMGVVFRFWEDVQGTPAWNLRMLPFWYLGVYLLMGVGVAELVLAAGDLAERGAAAWRRRRAAAADARVAAGALVADDAPTPAEEPTATGAGGLADGLVRVVVVAVLAGVLAFGALHDANDNGTVPRYWAKLNYSGYEARGASARRDAVEKQYPEYRQLMETMRALPPGRALWEGGSSIGKYGTPLALMLLPYWTKGRIASMEGLYYEASATTPYVFQAIAALVTPGNASNPVRSLPYRNQDDFELGVRWLQALGVRYFLTSAGGTQLRADRDPRLKLVATSPDLDDAEPRTWNVYEVRGARVVAPLTSEPVVVTGVKPRDWQDDVGVSWFDDFNALDRPLAAGGPDSWVRATPSTAGAVPKRALPRVRVTDVRTTRDSVSFRVSRTGVPVLVKTSYFPNWEASGATGPWRVTPNFMVVVPTEREVTLRYGTTSAEWLGRLGTLAGLVGLGLLAWWPSRRRRRRDRPGGPGGGGGRGGRGGRGSPAPAEPSEQSVDERSEQPVGEEPGESVAGAGPGPPGGEPSGQPVPVAAAEATDPAVPTVPDG